MHEDGFTPVVPGFRPVVPAPVLSAREEARALVAAAEASARELRAAATAEVDRAVQAALEAAEARHAGLLAARLAEAERVAATRLELLEAHAVDAVLAVAERTWRGAAIDTVAATAEVARELRVELGRAPGCTLRVHPAEVDAVSGLGFEVVADPGLDPGDCVVCGPSGLHDARAEVRARLALEALAAALGRVLPEEAAP